jgi:hypothetical protein
MTAIVVPLFKTDEGTVSLDGKRDQSTLIYLIQNAATRSDAYSAVLAVAPAVNPTDNLAFQSMAFENVGRNAWIARCEYGIVEPLDVGEWTFSWDSTGATTHLSVARACRVYSVAGYTAPVDLKKAIAVDRDRRVQGVDVPSPSLKLTISYRLPKANITMAYIRALSKMVGCCNDASYGGFDAYELLFLGSTGRKGSTTDPTIDFHFLVGENLTGQTFGDITGVEKRAHELIWPWFGDAKDATADELITKPKALYVSEVVEAKSFISLGTDNVPGGSAPTTTTTAA